MKKEHKILLIAILVMLILNFSGSIASRAFDFNYAFLSPISFIIYGLVGFLVTKEKDIIAGLICAGILGFLESTLGSFVSKIFGEPNTGDLQFEMTTGTWIFMIVGVTVMAAITGAAGGAIALMLKKKSTE